LCFGIDAAWKICVDLVYVFEELGELMCNACNVTSLNNTQSLLVAGVILHTNLVCIEDI
jgi:hypothetical protein